MLLDGIISGLFVAWILSCFGVDIIFVNFIKEMFHATITTSTYYVVFALIGLINSMIRS